LSEQIQEVALTEEEKDTILSYCGPEPLLVGGQALAFWAVWFKIESPAELGDKITTDADFIEYRRQSSRLGSTSDIRGGRPHAPRSLWKTKLLTEDDARNLASHWIRAWNAHDLDEIMSHYGEDVVLVSPVAAKILNVSSGAVKGKEALRAYFKRGLDAYPNLEFDLIEVMWGISSVILYYKNQKGGKTGEFMEIDSKGKVVRVVANYNE
jgi:hypothetical protein